MGYCLLQPEVRVGLQEPDEQGKKLQEQDQTISGCCCVLVLVVTA